MCDPAYFCRKAFPSRKRMEDVLAHMLRAADAAHELRLNKSRNAQGRGGEDDAE